VSERPWWNDAVVYQLYVRSFADGNGDGAGDLLGIIDRLDHIASLGVDAIWLNPCYPSPQRDHGYDVADYFEIEPAYGDLGIFDRLIGEARRRGIRVMMDVVPNHCSDRHPWFVEALRAGRGSRERERFWFRDGRGENGDEPPNNWTAMFGGPAWTRVVEPDGSPGQWYLATFTPWQPDFNWYHDDVGDYFDRMLRFWFDRGVEGFRADAVFVVGKDPNLPDFDAPGDVFTAGVAALNPATSFHESGHDVWRRWRSVVDRYEDDHPGRSLVTVAEVYAPGRPQVLARFVESDQFHQAFIFDLMLSPWNAESFHRTAGRSYARLREAGAHLSWALNNHDNQRIVTRTGRSNAHRPESWTGNNLSDPDVPVDVALGARRSRAAALLLLGLPGAVYLYMGEELGLPEVLDIPDDRRQDPIFFNTGGRQRGRDGCRVPMPWTVDPRDAHGFSGADPWLPQPSGWGSYSAEAQGGDESSMLALYRRTIAARRTLNLEGDDVEFVGDGSDGLFCFVRGRAVVIVNTTESRISVPAELARDREVLVESVAGAFVEGSLDGDSAVWLLRSGDRRVT